ncbi:unnamed protein product [Orchesella dallaii]|uniref:Uncharacterized protein n=1 Tax=Orchesella dallaii TaxID=48710 RepID=A0ABP1RS61_9HEXA
MSVLNYVLHFPCLIPIFVVAFLQSQNSQLNRKMKQKVLKGEVLVLIAAILTTFIPLGFIVCVLHPLEPTHIMIEKWLEIDLHLHWKYIPFLFIVMAVISKAAVTVFNGAVFAFCYGLLTTICIKSLTPEHVTTVVQRQSNANASQKAMIRYSVVTQCFGTLDDMTVVKMYRTQQVLNNRINEIYGSILFSIHHVACLCVFVRLSLTLVKCPLEALMNSGPIMFLVFAVGSETPSFIEYVETHEISEVNDVSNAFTGKCNRMLSRRSMLRKTAMSCRRFRRIGGSLFHNNEAHFFGIYISRN